MENLQVTPYEFQGVPLTPTIAQVLIRQLFTGRLVERQALVEEVVREHVNRGGLRAAAQDATVVFKKALASLSEAGEALNPAHGYWRIQGSAPVDLAPVQEPELEPPEPEPKADREFGTGPSAVYAYYLPTYRMLAEEHAETAWPCKIGRTNGDPLARVMSQASTALPEPPRVALVIRTLDSVAWEAALHGALSIRGRRIDSSPGSEWFLTSPEEIVEVAKALDPLLFADVSA